MKANLSTNLLYLLEEPPGMGGATFNRIFFLPLCTSLLTKKIFFAAFFLHKKGIPYLVDIDKSNILREKHVES